MAICLGRYLPGFYFLEALDALATRRVAGIFHLVREVLDVVDSRRVVVCVEAQAAAKRDYWIALR
jgi:hypothetical protein